MAADIILPVNGIKKHGRNNRYAGKPIAEIVVNGFFAVDKKWTVLYWNKAAEKILRINAADKTLPGNIKIFIYANPL